MSNDLRQSLTAWGAVSAMLGLLVLVVWLDIRVPDWVRQAYWVLFVFCLLWAQFRRWRQRRKSAEPA